MTGPDIKKPVQNEPVQGTNYFLASSTETFLNSLNSLLVLKLIYELLYLLLCFFSACWLASVANASNSALIFSISSFIYLKI
jgi:hypothetical protein